MRRTPSALAGAILLVGTVVALVPGSFAAGPTATEFHYGIVANEGPPPVGGRFDYQAVLVDEDQHPVAGVPAVLQVRSYGEKNFHQAASATTAPDGTVQASTVLTTTSTVRWVFAGTAEYAASTSVPYRELVAPRVTARVQDNTLRGKQRVVVVGTSNPLKPGSRVSLWRGDKPAFAPDLHMTRIAVGTIRPDGTFRITARFANPGAKKLYVKVNAGHGTAEGYSAYVRIRVTR